jgi:EmrB/QacA subfamily drug resistance transporter
MATTDTAPNQQSLSPQASDRRWWVLVVLCLSVLLVTVDNTIVNVALPTLSRELAATTSQLQWVVDGYTLAFAGLLLVGGSLGDRLGRRRILQVGLALFGLTSFLAVLATSTGQLVAARVAMGASAALVYPATLALLTNTFTDARERATAIGIWSGVSGLAVALGPVSGGLLLQHFSWGSVFLVNVPLVVVALLAGWRLLPESRHHDGSPFDWPGAVLSVLGVATLVWTLIEAPSHGWTSATTLGGFVLATVVLGLFVRRETRIASPLFDVRLFTNLRFSAASGAVALAFFGLFGFIFVITQYFQAVRGYGTLQAGVATLPFAVVTGALSPVGIVAMKRFGTKVVVAGGLALMSAGFVVAAGSAVDSPYWGRVVLSMTLMAAGLALTAGPATDAIMGALPPSRAGAVSAVNDTTREVGGTLGVAVVGSALASLYASHLADSLGRLGLPSSVVSSASDSVVAGLAVAERLPEPVRGPTVTAVKDAFMAGLAAGSLVAAVATGLAAVGALVLLPARARGAGYEEPVDETVAG